MEKYYYRFRGQVKGPCTLVELKKLAQRHQFARHYQVSADGVHWSRAGDNPELFPPAPVYDAPLPLAPDDGWNSGVNEGNPVVDSVPTAPTSMVDGELAEPMTEAEPDEYTLEPIASQDVLDASVLAVGTQQTVDEPIWYYTHDEQEIGPVGIQDLRMRAQYNQLSASDFVWCDGMPDWVRAGDIPNLCPNFTPPVSVSIRPVADAPPVSSLAVSSFILGLLGATALFFLGSVAAVVTGHMALVQIERSEGTIGGGKFATAGLILGYFVIAATLATLIVIIMVLALRPGS